MRGTLAADNGDTNRAHTSRMRPLPGRLIVLDGAWLGLLMKNFCREQLAPIVRMGDGGMAPNLRALFGLVVYGVYDFTNYSTLRQWPFVVTLADVAWGTFATAACAAVVRLVVR
jgi:Predicted membrane protein (DUF2177)